MAEPKQRLVEPGAAPPALEDELAIARLITEHAADAIFLLDGGGCTTYANPAAEAMFGWSLAELRGRTLHDVVHYQYPDGRPFPMEACPLGQVFLSGRSLKLHEDVFFRKGGAALHVACSNAAISRGGRVVGGVVIVRDITERREADQRQQLLLHELRHRVKNSLAVVQSIAQQTFRGGDSANREAFEGRLAALSQAHNLLTDSDWTAASLAGVVRGAVLPFAPEGRVSINGPEVTIPAKASVSVALAIHELATNASKYGAWSVPGGIVTVDWSVGSGLAGSMLHFVWQEQGGPAVAPPARRGFGSRMLERALAAELGGSVAMSFEPVGLRCTIDAPLPA